MDKRTRWIDIAKGIGILLVTLGHSRFGSSGYPGWWINSFHMPLFFVMAGLCFDETRYPTYWGYFKRKCVALLYPYFGLAVFAATVMMIFCVGDFTNYYYKIICNQWGPNGWWFVEALFVVELVYALLVRITPRRYRCLMSIVMACLAYAVVAHWLGDSSVINLRVISVRLHVVIVSLAYYCLGHCLRPFVREPQRTSRILGVAVLVACAHALAIAMSYRVTTGYSACIFGNPVMFVLVSLLGVVAVATFSMCISMSRWFAWLACALAWHGKYSICLLAIHGVCGLSRQSWCSTWPILAGLKSQVLELSLMALLMWLLSGPLNFFMRMPSIQKFVRLRNQDEA